MNKYNCTAIKYAQLLRIAWHETSQKPSVAQHKALLFQIAIWSQAPVIKSVFHPASYKSTAGAGYQGCLPSCKLQIHSRCSLSGGLAKWKFVDCACKLRDLEIAHVCYAISRLERNLRILRMRNAISRLRKFSDCAEHIHAWMVVPIPDL